MLLYIHKTRDHLSIVGNSCLRICSYGSLISDICDCDYQLKLVLGSVYLYIVYSISCALSMCYGILWAKSHL